MGGCTSKSAAHDPASHKLPDDKTAASTSAVQKQPAVVSPPTNLGSAKDSPSEAEITTKEVGTKTAQHEVRTVVADASDFDRQDVTGVISLDEGNAAVTQQPAMNNVNIFDQSAQLTHPGQPQERLVESDLNEVSTPRNMQYSSQQSAFASSADYASGMPDLSPATIGTPDASQADPSLSASRWDSQRRVSGTPRSLSTELGRPRWNSTPAAAAAQARKTGTPASIPRPSRSSTPRPVRRTTPEPVAPEQMENFRTPSFMAATRASSSKLALPAAPAATPGSGRHPYGLLEPPSTVV